MVMSPIPMCHIESLIRKDGLYASYMVVETDSIDPKTGRTQFFYVIVLVNPETKEEYRAVGYTSKHIDAACSYVRALTKNRAFT